MAEPVPLPVAVAAEDGVLASVRVPVAVAAAVSVRSELVPLAVALAVVGVEAEGDDVAEPDMEPVADAVSTMMVIFRM